MCSADQTASKQSVWCVCTLHWRFLMAEQRRWSRCYTGQEGEGGRGRGERERERIGGGTWRKHFNPSPDLRDQIKTIIQRAHRVTEGKWECSQREDADRLIKMFAACSLLQSTWWWITPSGNRCGGGWWVVVEEVEQGDGWRPPG